MALVSDSSEVSLLVIQKDSRSCAEKVLQCLLDVQNRIKSLDEEDNFLQIARFAYRLIVPQDTGNTHFESLEDFARAHPSQNLTVSTTANTQKKILMKEAADNERGKVSAESIKLLNADIPSKTLQLFDPDYGKHRLVKIETNPNRIVPGTMTVEQYVELMGKIAEGSLNVRKLGQKAMMTRMMSFKK